MLDSKKVTIAVGRGTGAYPQNAPFRPAAPYPEIARRVRAGEDANGVYALMRSLFEQMGLDADRAGTPEWNPLGEVVRPGDKVVIKPNLVRHRHVGGGDYRAVVTHASVVRAIADYVALALQGRGEIVVGDAPVQGTDFDAAVQRTGLGEVCNDLRQCWGLPVRLADFRLWALRNADSAWLDGRGEQLEGDQDGYRAVDLGPHSMLSELQGAEGRYRVTCYDAATMLEHHNEARHEYLIAGAVLSADVVINVPKLKTHRKVGLTAALKNLVGINGHKNWLPHHRAGSIPEGGDEYPNPSFLKRVQTQLIDDVYRSPGLWSNGLRMLGARALARLNRYVAPDPFHEGSWYGNDTCWRMCHDLNRLLLYADEHGRMTESVQRRVVTFVDAIVAGEGDGPMCPDARPCNWLIAGENPVAVDATLATLIGFDYRKLALIRRAFETERWPLLHFGPDDIDIRSNEPRFNELQIGAPFLSEAFRPPSSWVGHVEFSDSAVASTSA